MLLFNCQDNFLDEEIAKENLQEKIVTAKGKPKKKIKYRGKWVNHRFKSSEKELKEKHTKKYLKKLYNKLKKKYRNKNVTSKGVEEELPSEQAIFEATKVVINQFPYPEIEGFVLLNKPEKDVVDVNLIQQDFSNMSLTEIENNLETIDNYYSQNLEYAVLDEIAQNPGEYENLRGKMKSCNPYLKTMAEVMSYGYGFVRASIAYSLAGKNAEDSANNFNNFYPSSMAEGNSRKDAYRHLLWNALLAQYYWTIIPSKYNRTKFARIVVNKREDECPNAIDATEMDYHNNLIGRNLWSQHTGLRKVLGITVGLKLKSTSQLKDIMYNQVENFGCYIVKEDDRYNDTLGDYSEAEVKEIILTKGVYVPVYFVKPIAPKQLRSYISYVPVDCDDSDASDIIVQRQGKKTQSKAGSGTGGSKDCLKKVITTVLVDACYVSKDPNFNPYN